jgi:hypothetical protein
MDVARDPDGGVVIQYMNQPDFERALALLPDASAEPTPKDPEQATEPAQATEPTTSARPAQEQTTSDVPAAPSEP